MINRNPPRTSAPEGTTPHSSRFHHATLFLHEGMGYPETLGLYDAVAAYRRPEFGWPFFWKSRYPDDCTVAVMLYDLKVDKNAYVLDEEGVRPYPLIREVLLRAPPAVVTSMLIDSNVDINARDADGETPFGAFARNPTARDKRDGTRPGGIHEGTERVIRILFAHAGVDMTTSRDGRPPSEVLKSALTDRLLGGAAPYAKTINEATARRKRLILGSDWPESLGKCLREIASRASNAPAVLGIPEGQMSRVAAELEAQITKIVAKERLVCDAAPGDEGDDVSAPLATLSVRGRVPDRTVMQRNDVISHWHYAAYHAGRAAALVPGSIRSLLDLADRAANVAPTPS